MPDDRWRVADHPVRMAVLTKCPLTRAGVTAMMARHADVKVIPTDGPGHLRSPVDVALLDSPDRPEVYLEQLKFCVANPWVGRVAAFTLHADAVLVERALRAGVSGVLLKTISASTLANAVQRIAAGQVVIENGHDGHAGEPSHQAQPRETGDVPRLSPREAQMVTLICRGWTNEQIASSLYLSANSVKSYIRSAYSKIGVQRRSQAVAWGIEHGLRDNGFGGDGLGAGPHHALVS